MTIRLAALMLGLSIATAHAQMPPRPPAWDTDAVTSWHQAMAVHAHAHMTAEKPWKTPFRAGTPVVLGRMPGETLRAALGSPNWSGALRRSAEPNNWTSASFAQAQAEFNVPVAQQATGQCSPNESIEVTWVGLDGWGSSDVLQGGSLSGATCSGGATSVDYCAWVEWYPSNYVTCEFTVNPGDDLFAEAWVMSQTQGYVYLLDKTSGVYKTVAMTPASGAPVFLGNTAEYIVERPSVGGTYAPLANYITNWFSGLGAWTFDRLQNHGPGEGIGSKTSVQFVILDSQANPISSSTLAGTHALVFQDAGCAQQGGC